MRAFDAEVPAEGEAPATPAYVVLPDGSPRYGVVVIHEIFGRQPEIDRACDRIGREGIAVIAPDLMARGRVTCLLDTFRSLRTGRGIAVVQANAARAWLMRETGLPKDRIALLGFCMGGGFALAAGRGWGAVSANYGLVPTEEVLQGIGPTIACFGGRDRIFAPKAAVLDQRLEKVGARHEVHVFPEAGHSFLTDADNRVGRFLLPPMHLFPAPEERERAWAKIFGFFDECFAA